eukprot:XP_025011557.1 deleted in malignant brain tumors 1 protein-like [Gallus gallus]
MGRVEVEVQGTWGTLCASRWDLLDAHVLCHHLGCGFAVSVPEGGHFGRGTGPVWSDSFHCEGTESSLDQCPVTALGASPCFHENDAAVICSGPPHNASLRLVGGGSRCDGHVEIFQRGTWGRVLDDQWDMEDASVVCRQLRCGEAEAAYTVPRAKRGTGPVGLRGVRCAGHEASLSLCNTSLPEATGIMEDLGLPPTAGSRQVRLVDGAGRCAGRVEIYYRGQWGTVCDDAWDTADANVVCRQLSCGWAVEAAGSARFGEGSGHIWLDGVNCSGDETALWNCSAEAWGQHDCGHKEDAGVVCSEFMALRLENSDGCSGRLQVFYNGTWGSVGSNSMTPHTAKLVCKELGCGDGGTREISIFYGRVNGTAWLDHVQCGESNSSFWQCPSDPWELQSYDDVRDETNITCNGKRATRAQDPASLTVTKASRGGASRGPPCCPLHRFLHCYISFCREKAGKVSGSCVPQFHELHRWELLLCVTSGPVTLVPREVTASADREKIRAVGGKDGCSGRVEVWHRGSWGTVCDDSWDMQDAEVACRQLGCGPAVSALAEAAFGEGTGPIWLEQVECRGTEPSLQACWARTGDGGACRHKEDAAVNCLAATSVTASPPQRDPILDYATISRRVSVPVIICIILGLLICLLLALLARQMQSARARHRDSRRSGEPFSEAVYEEIEYSPMREKKMRFSFSDIPVLPGDSPVEGYDDARRF